MTTRIILADDHRIMREGLRTMLVGNPDLKVLGEADNGHEAIELAEELRPDVVVMDVAMPDMNGIEATRRIVGEVPHVKVVALSMHSDKRFVMEMLHAGASGYLLKDAAFEELAKAIETVADGQTYLSPTIADVVVASTTGVSTRKVPAPSEVLTPREREVLQLIAEGNTTKGIAAKLDVSVKTIESHRQNTMKKLKTRSVAELTKYAIREGLTSL
jgi:DNA-binding NarL/FixJ family response regulator